MHKSVLDYMEWRGDLSFTQAEFCEVDALIFAWLIYYNMEDFREKGLSAVGMTVREIAETHVREFGPLKEVDPMSKPFPVENAEFMLRAAAETERFGNAVVEDFAAINGKMSGAQFAAGSFLPGDGRRVIAYRGTDTSVAGWKENCRMAYEEKVPAQLLAAAYMEKMMMDGKEAFICGHSKGGNLALYTALQSRPETEKRICRVYNFDGPGFCFDWYQTEKYTRLRDRIVTVVPESTIVGALLNHDDQYGIVASELSGLMQHNSFCWHVRRSQFVRVPERSKMSLAIEKAMQEWLSGMNDKERKEAVQMLFSVIEDTGIVDFRELMEDTVRKGRQILQGLAAWSPKQKERIGKLIVEILRQSGNPVPAAMAEKIMLKGENPGDMTEPTSSAQ